MAAPKWMQDLGDRMTGTDLSGRKAAAAAEKEKSAAKAAEAEQAKRDAAKKKVGEISFKNGGLIKQSKSATKRTWG